jgi:hypothetical protein
VRHGIIKNLHKVLFLLLLCACGAGTASLAAPEGVSVKLGFRKLVVIGERHNNGIADASLEYDAHGIGWLSYSRVTLPAAVDIHVATSPDHGRTWKYAASPYATTPCAALLKGRPAKAVCRYETSALLFDPEDSPDRRWKLYAERYPSVPPHDANDNLHGEGVIEVKYAPSPAGPWSRAECVFGPKGKGCYSDLRQAHPDLKEMRSFNELGIVYFQGIIYMSMDASTTVTATGEWGKRRIILVSSSDHGRTWQYTGTLTDSRDAEKAGYLVLTASSLVKQGDKVFFYVTPSGAKGLTAQNRRHDGTFLVEFEDITRARLRRDASGALAVLAHVKAFPDAVGQADHDQGNHAGGMIQSHIDLKAPSSTPKGSMPQFFNLYQAH